MRSFLLKYIDLINFYFIFDDDFGKIQLFHAAYLVGYFIS